MYINGDYSIERVFCIKNVSAITDKLVDSKGKGKMKLDELDFEQLPYRKPYPEDMVFKIDGMSEDEYIAKITEEINAIDLTSVPIDKWDIWVTFLLATLEVSGDFFLGDPDFKYSLANRNGRFVKELNKIHDNDNDRKKWQEWLHKKLDHSGSVLDYQGVVKDSSGNIVGSFSAGGVGNHRVNTFGHDLPLMRFLFGSDVKEDDSTGTKVVKRTYNTALIIRDILHFGLALYSICNGTFVDCVLGKDGKYVWISTTTNQNGVEYTDYNIFEGIIKYLVHMLADFCSNRSLPIPGWSLLSHFPDRDVQAFALKLYKNGMNLRTMAMQGIPVALTELLMSLYIWLRSKDCKENYSEDVWERKKDKLLCVAHGITTAVNVGKVIITKAPWRLNLVVITRTFYLVFKVVSEESDLTNRHIEKADLGILKARIETAKTLILLDKATYETQNVQQLLDSLDLRMRDSNTKIDNSINDLNEAYNDMLDEIGE